MEEFESSLEKLGWGFWVTVYESLGKQQHLSALMLSGDAGCCLASLWYGDIGNWT